MVKNYPILKKIAPLFFLLFSFAAFSQTQIFSTPGTSTFTVPSCVSSVTIQAWGGGASGGAKNNDARGGGGGGGYVTNTYPVTVGQTIAIVVGVGGIIITTQTNGGASSYNYSSLVVAGGGNITNADNGGAGGAISGLSGAGSIKGGNGAKRVGKDTQGGGGGGSGPSATNASGQTGGTPGGGNGGNTSSAGFNGTAPGGGGGGKGGVITSSIQSGNGANGQVIITWTYDTVSTPTIGTITQPTCVTATGSVILNGLPAAGTWTLTRSPGAITSTGTGTSTTISGLPTGTYNYTVTNVAGCTSTASENMVINSQPSINTWNGLVSSDWNTAGNWCSGVPSVTNNLDVLIPSGLLPTYPYPILSTGASGYVENIDFELGTTLNVVDNFLRVTGNLTLNGKIDLEGESQLLQDEGSVLDATSTGTIEIDQQGEGNKYRYNYWSMPVYTANDGTNYTSIFASLRDGTNPSSPGTITFNNSGYDGSISPFTLSSYWMYKYTNSGSGYSAWNQIRSTGKVYAGQGFTMKGSKNPVLPVTPEQNYTFVGKPNNGTIELAVAANNDYLVGNPYPSAIDADQFLSDNSPSGTSSITGSIYFWEHYGGDTHNLAGYQGGYATYSLGGGVQASAFPGLGGGISVKGAPKQYIPVGQAFFVVGDAVDGGQIQFNNGQRIFEKESDGNSIFMKNSNTKAKTENTRGADLRPKFRIGFDAPKISHRQLLMTIDERATPVVDWGFDAEIYEVYADDMYWMLNNKKYVIQGTNEVGLNSEVQLGIQLSKTGIVTVKIDALENVDDSTSIYLKDKLTGESFNMKDKPVQLNLMAGKYADRFVITFKTQKLVAEDVVAEVLIPAAVQPIIEGIHVFMNNAIGELQIKNNSNEELVSVELFNYLGQRVNYWNTNLNRRIVFLPINIATGIYVVQLNTKTTTLTNKILIK